MRDFLFPFLKWFVKVYKDLFLSCSDIPIPIIISCLTFIVFAIAYLFSRRYDKNKSFYKKISFWIPGILGSLLAPYTFLFVSMFITSYVPTRSFDRDDWFEHPRDRREMVDDLMASGILDNKSHAEIEAFLGTASNVSYWKTEDCDVLYNLGYERSCSLDDEWLLLCFENDRVVDYSLHTD